ncbi:MAG TPA: hypothetical protein VEC60_18870 [Reyranella sp.]|nr:hypothetical protein [Reyranella sp.]
MNCNPITGEPYPRLVDCIWVPAGYYIVSTGEASRSFRDPDECAAAVKWAVDPRFEMLPEGNC